MQAFVDAWTPVTNEFYLGGVDSYTNGDLDFNGKNDLNDVFLMRQAALGAGVDASQLENLSAVPEPSCFQLLLLAPIALLDVDRRRRDAHTVQLH